MTNRELFHKIFDRYSSELWAMPEEDLIKWQLEEAIIQPDESFLCEDCIWWEKEYYSNRNILYKGFCMRYYTPMSEDDYCSRGERK